jgi:hypothetical protein
MQVQINPQVLAKRLARIESMQGSDPGFALLALMSFIEAFLREYLDDYSPRSTLPDLLQSFGEVFGDAPHYTLSRDRELLELLHYQKLANSVRHHFVDIGREEYTAALFRLFAFLNRLGIEDDELSLALSRIEKALEVWKSRKSHFDDFRELMETGFQLARSHQENAVLRRQLEIRIRELNRQTSIDSDEGSPQVNPGMPDEGNQLSLGLDRPEERYIGNLRRLCVYARSLRDFERQLIEPSEEQIRVLKRIAEDGDFLVSGAAGTGKTLLLIMALRRYISNRTQQFTFTPSAPTVSLLTYTSTLTKYNRYLSNLVESSGPRFHFSTVDALINSMMEDRLVGRKIEYSLEHFLPAISRMNDPALGIQPMEALEEIEEYLFAHAVDREQYLDEGRVRRGRETRLSREQRRGIWRIRDEFAQFMEDQRIYTRNFGRVRLLEQIEQERSSGGFREPYEKLFIDEVQDLNAADIAVLKRISQRGVVMAGDREQSIFLGGFSFDSMGIRIARGNSAILRQNFRNSAAIHRFAAAIRGDDSGLQAPDRPGPPVEIFTHESRGEGLEQLVERAEFAVRDLGYSPESVAILAPRGADLRDLQQMLGQRGMEARPVKDSRFDFSQSPGLRLSTFHSVKGLDFAAVLAYLPGELYARRTHDEEITRHLLYVVSSRAMELLWFFSSQGPAAEIPRRALEECGSNYSTVDQKTP